VRLERDRAGAAAGSPARDRPGAAAGPISLDRAFAPPRTAPLRVQARKCDRPTSAGRWPPSEAIVMSAPRSRRRLASASSSFWAAVWSAVKPPSPRPLTSAPALRSRRASGTDRTNAAVPQRRHLGDRGRRSCVDVRSVRDQDLRRLGLLCEDRQVKRGEPVVGHGSREARLACQQLLQPFDAAECRCIEDRQFSVGREQRSRALDVAFIEGPHRIAHHSSTNVPRSVGSLPLRHVRGACALAGVAVSAPVRARTSCAGRFGLRRASSPGRPVGFVRRRPTRYQLTRCGKDELAVARLATRGSS
jgi:hypothetical protein